MIVWIYFELYKILLEFKLGMKDNKMIVKNATTHVPGRQSQYKLNQKKVLSPNHFNDSINVHNKSHQYSTENQLKYANMMSSSNNEPSIIVNAYMANEKENNQYSFI
jgi:hypothetical protein